MIQLRRPSADTTDELRAWLRVPGGLGVPRWARRRLGAGVREELAARAGVPVERAVFGVVDLETTGASPASQRILEIGLVVQRGGRVVRRFTTLIDVEVAIPGWITALTGIDPSAVVDAPAEAEAIANLDRVLAEEGVEALVAHNAGFDRAFLVRAWERHDLRRELPPLLCSLKLARRWVRAPRYTLDALVEQLDIPRAARHRALGDAEMTAVLWSELLQRGKLRGVHTLQALCDEAETRRSRDRRVRAVDARTRIG